MIGKSGHKSFALGNKAAGVGVDVNDAILAKINAFALKALTADEIYVRKQILAHNGVDRDRERFPEMLLEDFARTLPGKSTLYSHDRHNFLPLGLYFDAATEQIDPAKFTEMTGEQPRLPEGVDKVKVLWAWFYVIKTPRVADVIANIEGGTYRHWSIGFSATDLIPVKGPYDQILYWEYAAPGEAREGSLVWLGAQQGATSQKAVDDIKHSSEENMSMKVLITLLGKALGKTLAPETSAETLAKEIETVINSQAATITDLSQQLQSAKSLADIGVAYRDDLVAKYVALKAKLGEAKEDEGSQKQIKAVVTGYPLDFLKSEVECLEKRVAEKFPDKGQLTAPVGDRTQSTDNPLIPKQ